MKPISCISLKLGFGKLEEHFNNKNSKTNFFHGLAECKEILSCDQSTFTVLVSSDEWKKGTPALEQDV